jgi:CRP-like cAMP-binding protein/uncharacterized protein (DUF2225 family)
MEVSDGKNIFLELEKGQTLFVEGDEGKEMYIILSGAVQVFLLRDGLQIILANMKAGRFFGEMSLLEQEPRSACAIALEPTKLLVVNGGNFQDFICQNPSLAIKLMKGLSGRLRAGNEQISLLEKKVHHLTTKNIYSNGDKKDRTVPIGNVQQFQENLMKSTIENVSCPVCFSAFSARLLQVDRRLKYRNYWLREFYDGLEPLWFKQIGCPQCSFAAPFDRFIEIGQLGRQYLKAGEAMRKGFVDLSTMKEYGYEYVLALYRLALLSIEEKDENLEILAQTALELSWLYGDIQKLDEERETLKKALVYLEEINTKESQLKPDLLQGSFYFQGLIHLRFGNNKKALGFFEQTLDVEGAQDGLVYLFAREILEALLLEKPIKI